MIELTAKDGEDIENFGKMLQANRHLDLPEFKDLVRQETRKLSPGAKQFVAQILAENALGEQ